MSIVHKLQELRFAISEIYSIYIYASTDKQNFQNAFLHLAILGHLVQIKTNMSEDNYQSLHKIIEIKESIQTSSLSLYETEKKLEILLNKFIKKDPLLEIYAIIKHMKHNILNSPHYKKIDNDNISKSLEPIFTLLNESMNTLQLQFIAKYLETLAYEPHKYTQHSHKEIKTICNKIYYLLSHNN